MGSLEPSACRHSGATPLPSDAPGVPATLHSQYFRKSQHFCIRLSQHRDNNKVVQHDAPPVLVKSLREQ